DDPLSPPGESACTLALIGFSACEASGRLHSWSLTLLWFTGIVAILGVLSSGSEAAFLLLVASLVPAACQACFSWRLTFDKQIFAAWAQLQDDESQKAQRAFDAALRTLSKKEIPAGEVRSMPDRVMGVRRLHRFQIAALLGQVLVLVIGLLWVSSHA
ncbi:MAG: hypothetical protein LBE22_00070, partial [Azoarcus sp.]|nr:hypothetical protein [Azoarcus sp.]